MAPDARFSFANERTMLAWLRTSLSFVVTGLALSAASDLLDRPWVPVVAAGSVTVGAVLAPWSYLRWRACERAMAEGRPLPRPALAVPVVAGVLVMAVVTVVELVSRA